MRVLQIGMGNNPGGVEAFVMNYYRVLKEQGVQFDFVCMYGTIAYAEEIGSLGGRVFEVPNIKNNYPGYVKAVKQVMERGKYDVIHVHMLSAANITPLRLAAEYGRAKVFAHSHNTSAPGLIRNVMDKLNRPKIDKYADRKLACGKKAARWLFGDKACRNGEVTLVRNAIDVEKFLFSAEKRKTLREGLGFGDDFVIGHVGRFEIQKNHDGLLRIFKAVTERIPNARLFLIGDGVLREETEKKASELGIRDRVFFAGVRENVADLLSVMDVFLFPSLFEGLPFTLVEAQANSLPCVISDTITGEAVVCEGRVTRVSLDAEPEEWAQAVEDFRDMEREAASVTARRMKHAHFDISCEADRLRRIYES